MFLNPFTSYFLCCPWAQKSQTALSDAIYLISTCAESKPELVIIQTLNCIMTQGLLPDRKQTNNKQQQNKLHVCSTLKSHVKLMKKGVFFFKTKKVGNKFKQRLHKRRLQILLIPRLKLNWSIICSCRQYSGTIYLISYFLTAMYFPPILLNQFKHADVKPTYWWKV